MPLQKFVFKPGINKELTAYANEGGWFDSNLVRFRKGLPEKIGGWAKRIDSTFTSRGRGLHAWPAVDGTSNVYASNTDTTLASASGVKVYGVDAVLNSFTTTIDYPAVFSGISSTGYEVVSRGAECSVTHDCQIKYDGNTKDLISTFDAGTVKAENMFIIVNNGKFGIDTANGVFTNVALSEGDIMMLDCSIKAIDDGTDELLIVDLSDG